MSTGELLNLNPVGVITVDGAEYEVWSQEGRHGVIQLAWIIKASIVVAKVHGLVRGDVRIGDKEPSLTWADEFDAQAAASAFAVWDEAGLARAAVNSQ